MLDNIHARLAILQDKSVRMDVFDLEDMTIHMPPYENTKAGREQREAICQKLAAQYFPDAEGKPIGSPMGGIWLDGAYIAGEPNPGCLDIIKPLVGLSHEELFAC